MSTFFEDLAAVRPTVMLLIPRLATMMVDKLAGQLEQAREGSGDAKAAYEQARSPHLPLSLPHPRRWVLWHGPGKCAMSGTRSREAWAGVGYRFQLTVQQLTVTRSPKQG